VVNGRARRASAIRTPKSQIASGQLNSAAKSPRISVLLLGSGEVMKNKYFALVAAIFFSLAVSAFARYFRGAGA
jgi:hypothetical protein